jgi:hypothetical protein
VVFSKKILKQITPEVMTAEIQLLPCPFCGGSAVKKFIGNDYTRKRSVEIKCTKCFTKQVTGAIRNTMAWCEEQAIKQWNTREHSALKEQEVIYCIAEKDGLAQFVFYNDAPMLKAQGYTVTELVKKKSI